VLFDDALVPDDEAPDDVPDDVAVTALWSVAAIQPPRIPAVPTAAAATITRPRVPRSRRRGSRRSVMAISVRRGR